MMFLVMYGGGVKSFGLCEGLEFKYWWGFSMTDKISIEMSNADILVLTSDIVSSHIANNSASVEELPSIIEQVFYSLKNLSEGNNSQGVHNLRPAVPVKKSITPDYLICL